MRHKACKTCLWWWDLYDTGEWKCYFRDSPFFHKECSNGCKNHEDVIHIRMGLRFDPNQRKRKKEDSR